MESPLGVGWTTRGTPALFCAPWWGPSWIGTAPPCPARPAYSFWCLSCFLPKVEEMEDKDVGSTLASGSWNLPWSFCSGDACNSQPFHSQEITTTGNDGKENAWGGLHHLSGRVASLRTGRWWEQDPVTCLYMWCVGWSWWYPISAANGWGWSPRSS